MTCPHCGEAAKFINYLPRTVLTANGDVALSRAYYHCSHCRHGHVPWDDVLGLGPDRLSPGVRPLVALAGTLCPFGQAEDVLRRLAGLNLSDSTCRRITEASGDQLRAQHQRGEAVRPEDPRPWDFSIPEQDDRTFAGSVAYLGLDAFAVRIRGAQGKGVDWRMLYVGLLYDPRKQHTIYLTDFDFEVVGALLRNYATLFGLGQAQWLVALTDDGNGLQRVLCQNFSMALVCVSDFYHEVERLHTLGGLLHNHDPGAATAWSEQMKGLLWEQGGEAVLERLRALEGIPQGSGELQECWRRLVTHYEEDGQRLNYPEYRQKGWDVGSGPTEAGCKIVSGRVKGTGMRWCLAGSEQVAALRALYASGEGLWDTFFNTAHRPAA
jgi:hypothetical protein